MNDAIHFPETTVMVARKADVAELIVMRLSLDAERAAQSGSHQDRKAKLPNLWRRLLELAHDSDANVRLWVIEAMRDGAPAKYRCAVIGKLMLLTEDPDARVRRDARKALESYRREAQLSFFTRGLESVHSK